MYQWIDYSLNTHLHRAFSGGDLQDTRMRIVVWLVGQSVSQPVGRSAIHLVVVYSQQS